ncbi:MAG: hypothetical protein J7K33_01315 [Candidatus Marinimicrobia bacterium]|nr:hypothetical protein [Candidatus Neomarinimicrobiota bacterium]
MKILVIIPGLSKEYNDIYYMFKYIADAGNEVLVLTRNRDPLKASGRLLPSHERDGSLEIYRLFNSAREQTWGFWKKMQQISRIVSKFGPDIIVASHQYNLPLAIYIQRQLINVPIILLVEFAFNPRAPLWFLKEVKAISRKLLGRDSKLLFNIGAKIEKDVWSILTQVVSGIVTYNPLDRKFISFLREQYGVDVYYVPWPSVGYNEISNITKVKERAIYVGALAPHKNIPEFYITIPRILQETPTEEVYIIGDGKYRQVIDDLRRQYPQNIRHIKTLLRNEVLKLISSSYYSYVPSKRGSWGFILDSWRVRTPIISTHKHFELKSMHNSLVCSPERISDCINFLYENKKIYKKLCHNGYKKAKEHDALYVAGRMLLIFENILRGSS